MQCLRQPFSDQPFSHVGRNSPDPKATVHRRARENGEVQSELTVKVHEIPANELNRAIESLSRLAEVCGDLESLHINVESVFDTQGMLRVA